MAASVSAILPVFAQAPVLSSAEQPVVIRAGDEWIPLHPDLEIESGSALDFSALGFVDAPAGKHGRVIARPDGQFAFAALPDQPRRFYGVNLCFGAHYLSKEECDRLADRLVRLGYNTLRIHHYERELTGTGAHHVLESAETRPVRLPDGGADPPRRLSHHRPLRVAFRTLS